MGMAYAGFDEKENAIEAIDNLVVSENYIKDAIDARLINQKIVRIYVMLQEFDLALEIIPNNLNKEAFYSVNHLKLHPQFDPLRKLPEFQSILNSPKR